MSETKAQSSKMKKAINHGEDWFIFLRLRLGVHKEMKWNGMIIREWKIMELSNIDWMF